MPRGTSPTASELEFAYDLFYRGFTDVEVRKEWQEEVFPVRDRRTVKKYRRMYEDGMSVGRRKESTVDTMVAGQAKRHGDFLLQAVEFLKNYMGQASQMVNARWMPTEVDEFRIRDLLSHLTNPELEEAIRVATQDPPHDDKRGAAQTSLGILQHVLLRGVTSGQCEHCETPVRLG